MQSTHAKTYKLTSHGQTDVGLVRQNNEDFWEQLPQDSFYILADGMGGHQAGEIAARDTVVHMCTLVQKKITPVISNSTLDESKALLRRAIRHVNCGVFKKSRECPEFRGMGTTLCCLLFKDDQALYAHVGDSRIYLYRNFSLTQLTKDHSLLSQLMDQGQISEYDAPDFAHKNIITKAIGTEPKIEPTIQCIDIKEGDIFLMCSDGLSDLVSQDEIEEIVGCAPSINEAVSQLIAEANTKGGSDNITVVITKVEGLSYTNPVADETTPPKQFADLLR